jgi:uncharacterized protein (DUF885 family)
MNKTAIAAATGALLLILAGCKPAEAPLSTSAATPATPAPQAADQSAALKKLFDDEWQRMLADSPLTASYLGDSRYNDRWDDLTPEAFARRQQAAQAALDKLKSIDRAALGADMQLNYDLFKLQTEDGSRAINTARICGRWISAAACRPPAKCSRRCASTSPLDYQNWIKRLQSFGAYTDQTIALMKLGIAQGRTYPRVIMQRVPGQIAKQLVADPKQSPIYAPFAKIPADIADAEALRSAGEAAIREQVLPAFQRFQTFFDTEYLPACSRGAGPVGAAARRRVLRLPGAPSHHHRR